MKRFELGMSINYCSTWGVVEAVREIFQNALDAQTANPDNEMYFGYDKDKETLFVGNKKVRLVQTRCCSEQQARLATITSSASSGKAIRLPR